MDRRILLVIIPVAAYLVFSTLRAPAQTKIIGKDQFYISHDMGQTWEQTVVRDDSLTLMSLNFLSIAVDQASSSVIYLGTRENGLYKSVSSGQDWKRVEDKNNVFSKWSNVYDIAIDPNNSNRLYIATYQDKHGRLFRSQDAGESWEEIYVVSQMEYAAFSVAVDRHNSAVIYLGTAQEGGLLKSVDYGRSWQIVKWFDDVVSDIALNPFNSNEIYVGCFNKGLFKTTDGGQKWISFEENMKDFSQANTIEKVAFDPYNPNVIYTVSQYGILTSANGGKTWEEVNMVSPPNTVTAMGLAVDNSNTNYLFYGAGSILYNSLDRGRNWVVNQLPNEKRKIKALAIDPNNPNIIYAGLHE